MYTVWEIISFYLSGLSLSVKNICIYMPLPYTMTTFHVSDRGKRRNAGNQHFLFFPHAFYPINPFPKKPMFSRVCSKSLFENTMEKGENASNKQFLFFPQSFLPFRITFHDFHQTLKVSSANSFNLEESKICRWERVKEKLYHMSHNKIVVCECFQFGLS